jgi:Aspartyl protease
MRIVAPATLLLLTLLCVPNAAKAADNVTVEVPFTLEKGHVIVPAKIQGDKPVEVVLSTGTEHSLVNAALLQKYKLQLYYTGVGVITGHNDQTVTFANVTDISVGGVEASSLSMLLGGQTLANVGQRVGREIFAVLGADFFKGRVVQFDFRKKIVRFLPQSPDVSKGGDAGRAVMRFRYNAEVLTMPIVEDVTYNGKKVRTLLDTGALTVVALTPSAAKQVGLDGLAGNGAPSVAKVGSLRLGEMEFNDVPVSPLPKSSNPFEDMHGAGAVAGIALLQNFVVTFDYRDKVVVLERI